MSSSKSKARASAIAFAPSTFSANAATTDRQSVIRSDFSENIVAAAIWRASMLIPVLRTIRMGVRPPLSIIISFPSLCFASFNRAEIAFSCVHLSFAALFLCSFVPNTSLRARNHERNCVVWADAVLPGTTVLVMSRPRWSDLARETPASAQNCWIRFLSVVFGTNSVVVYAVEFDHICATPCLRFRWVGGGVLRIQTIKADFIFQEFDLLVTIIPPLDLEIVQDSVYRIRVRLDSSLEPEQNRMDALGGAFVVGERANQDAKLSGDELGIHQHPKASIVASAIREISNFLEEEKDDGDLAYYFPGVSSLGGEGFGLETANGVSERDERSEEGGGRYAFARVHRRKR
ncbi:hypothetical protein G2W53_038265 [Senna tora]|uniref:Uncharacterized protein n=1 Tax=Senna tora TaxID=362788 RepID=A0A834W6M3_9FABA|nr:hypothetical protein G2W53_038265 [Senna tora]